MEPNRIHVSGIMLMIATTLCWPCRTVSRAILRRIQRQQCHSCIGTGSLRPFVMSMRRARRAACVLRRKLRQTCLLQGIPCCSFCHGDLRYGAGLHHAGLIEKPRVFTLPATLIAGPAGHRAAARESRLASLGGHRGGFIGVLIILQPGFGCVPDRGDFVPPDCGH